MKKRLLSAFLAVMMVLTMAPVAFAADEDAENTAVSSASGSNDSAVAKIGDTGYATLAAAVDAANNGDTVQLLTDVLQNSEVCINKDITLDLNGKKIYNTKDIWADGVVALVNVKNNANVTITGNGKITAKENDCYAINLVSGTLTIENGNIVGNVSAVQVQAGHLYIKGGTFSLLQKWENKSTYLINMIDKAYQDGSARATITGGTFVDYKPSQSTSEHPNANFVPTGYNVTQDGDSYVVTVKSDNAAEISDIQYATLADAVAAANNGDTVTLLTNTAEDITIAQDKDITLDLNGKTLTNRTSDTITVALGANLTIEGEGTVDNISHGKAAVYNNGSVTLNGGTYTRSKETGDVKVDKNSYYNILNHGSMTINKDVTVEQSGNFSSLVANGYYDYEGVTSKGEKSQYIEGTNAAEPTLTIKGGTFSGGINTLKNDDGGNITINGGTVTNYTQAALQNHNVATINGGTFTADSKYVIDDCGCNEAHDSGELMIFGGTFMGKLYVRSPYSKVTIMDGLFKGDVLKTGGTLSTIGGYYSTDVAKYCPIGWTTVANTDKDTKDAYPYTIGVIPEIDDNEVKADVATGATNSTVDTEKITTEDARNAATTVANTVATTKPIADKSELTENDKKNAVTALKNAGQVTVDADGTISKNVTVIMQTYLDVTATEYVIGDTDDTYRVTMDITPKYNLVAVATENNEAVDVAKGVAYLQGQYLMNAGKTEVTVTLPTQYANKKVYITHKDDVYIATADENGKITFTTNGFSPFTFALTNSDVVAEVNGNAYKSLKEAIDAAQTGATIVLQKDCTEKVTVAGKSLTINRNSKNFDEANVTVGSNCTKEVKNDTIVVTYTKPSSGGSSGGSSSGKTTYKVTTSAVNNGGVNASPSSAEKGAVITITLSPDKGYKLDKLTVTDGSGKTVSTVKKSDTVYTFTMPASAVKVGVSYVKATETPSKTKFNDVSANDWFASAVDYVTGKGMMNGTADNTFSPKANTTRGMIVTVLYRLENQPSTSAASFTDVASGAYYANAVAWANANGIVSGYGSGKFGPNDKVTREQLAAILYRYAQYKKYDVSVGEDTNILSYDDAQSISSYAIPAIQWACGAGVVTGKSGSKLDSKGNATRAEVAAMLMRFCENVK